MTAKQEFRITCARHGTPGHQSHVWVKKDLKKAKQSKIDADHNAEMNPEHFYAKEAPYRIEVREVGPWEVAENV